MRRGSLVMSVVLGALLAGAGHAAEQQFDMPVVERGPELKGDLSDPVWEQGAQLGEFVLIDTGEAPVAATEARALCDAKALYVGFLCHEPEMAKLVTETSGHDGPVGADDCVGLVLDVPNGDTWCYHVLANSQSVHWTALIGPARTDLAWGPGVQAKSKRGEDSWTCELRIPFGIIGGAPQPGDTWGINLCRSRQAGTVELSSWVQAPEGFADAKACGDALFPTGEGPVTIRVLSRGGASADVAEPGMNTMVATVRNGGGGAARVVLAVGAEGVPGNAQMLEMLGGSTSAMRLPYSVPSEGRPVYTFTARVDDRVIYRSEVQAVQPIYRGPKSWDVPDPLYEELLSDQPPGLAREGALIWGHLNDVSLLRETARRFAVRYSEDEAYQIHADHHLMFIGHGVVRDLQSSSPHARFRVRNAPCPTRHYSARPFLLDPEAVEVGLQEVADVFTGPYPLVFGIFAGDEVDDYAIKQGTTAMCRPGDYAYIHQADAEVREQFGGGVYGIPAGLAERDPDPYKWIAFRRWCNARMRERNRRLVEIVRAHEPEMPIISVDGGGGLMPYEFSAQAELFDIFTAQHASRGNPWRCQLGFITKFLADLTGKEVWPCAHVENYVVGLTPEEVLEEFSQILRNGGSGLHLYLPDTGGSYKQVGDTRTCYFGSPRRWHTIMNVVDLLRTMPRPKYPDYDRAAILFNDDTLMATPYDAERPYAEQTEAAYTLIGPVARSWFRFIDCGQVLAWDDLAARLDIIYLPCARYQRPEIVDRLEGFVRGGGTLVCADPHAFETDLLANPTADRREELFGVTVGAALEGARLRPTGGGEPLALSGEALALQPQGDTEVLMRYEDGWPAVTSRRFGEGRAILFGANPFSFAAVESEQWRKFVTEWLKDLGAPTGLDIWRFRLPDSLIWHEPEPPGVCLTNNSVVWQEETPRTHLNHDSGGSYICMPAPDAMPDAVPEGSVRFSDGHLTDRRQAIRSRKTGNTRSAPYALPASRWMVSWQRTEPVTISFDLGGSYALREFRLWFSDDLPEVTVEVSADGERWTAAGCAQAQVAGEDVLDLAVPLDPAKRQRYLRASFVARQEGRKMTLVEAEVWGEGD